MGSIFDIPQQRSLVRCKDTQIVVDEPTWGISSTDNTALRFISTNHILDHNGQIDVLLTADDIDIPFATFNRNASILLVRLANACGAPTGRYYGLENIFKISGGSPGYSMDARRGLTSSTITASALPDNFFSAPGKVLSIILTNRFVGIKINNAFFTGSGWTQGTLKETPTGYVAGGNLPPAGHQFRWAGGQQRVREILVPMIRLGNTGTMSAKILAVGQGEIPDVNIPPQP